MSTDHRTLPPGHERDAARGQEMAAALDRFDPNAPRRRPVRDPELQEMLDLGASLRGTSAYDQFSRPGHRKTSVVFEEMLDAGFDVS